MKKRYMLGTLAAAVLALPAVSHASNIAITDDGHAAVIHYSDINLATSEGAAELYKLIRAGAVVVCGTADNRDLAGLAAIKTCRADAIARAVKQIGSSQLAVVARGHGAKV